MESNSPNNYGQRNAGNRNRSAQQINEIRQNFLHNQRINDRNYQSEGFPDKNNTYLPIRQQNEYNQQMPRPNYQQYPNQYSNQYPNQFTNQYPNQYNQQNPYSQNYPQGPYNQPNSSNQAYMRQTPNSNENYPSPGNSGPQLQPNSPIFRHTMSQMKEMVQKNIAQFSPQFQKVYAQNQKFKRMNDILVFLPSSLIMGHVIYNRNTKWFRLTANPRLIRYSLIGLLMFHLTNNFLYAAAFRGLIGRQKQRVQKMVVREEFLSGTSPCQ